MNIIILREYIVVMCKSHTILGMSTGMSCVARAMADACAYVVHSSPFIACAQLG